MALYDSIGRNYAALRRPDPRIAAAVEEALGDAADVINVGAGTGSYEPPGRNVLAVEPSETMIRQRPPGAAPCIQATAESLPVETASFDAAMAVLTVHHWTDLALGLSEMARVSRKRVVLLTWIPDVARFWLTEDYFPEIAAHDRTVFPSESALSALLERHIGPTQLMPLPIPHDCTDGFLCSYWRRPESYLRDDVRSAISSFSRFDATAGLARLADDLSSELWRKRNQHLLDLEAFDLGYRIIRCEIAAATR